MLSHNHINDTVLEAKTKPINFDKVDTSPYGFAILDGTTYGNVGWENFYVLNSEDSGVATYGNSGYFTGITSGDQVAYNPYFAADSSVFLSKGTFTFDSVQMTSAWNLKETVEIQGFDKKGNMIHDVTVKINDKGPLDVELHWDKVSRVTFVYNDNGKQDPNLTGSGNNVVFDDMVITNIKGTVTPPSEAHKIVADGAFGLNGHHESISSVHHMNDSAHPVHLVLA